MLLTRPAVANDSVDVVRHLSPESPSPNRSSLHAARPTHAHTDPCKAQAVRVSSRTPVGGTQIYIHTYIYLILRYIPPPRRPPMASSTAGHHLSSLRSGTEDTAASGSPPHDDAGYASKGGRKRTSADDTDGSSPSSQRQDAGGGGGGGANKKRKAAAFGTRGVANLTPEQLEKKRANGESLPQPPFPPTLLPLDRSVHNPAR